MDDILQLYKKQLEEEQALLSDATARRLQASDDENDHSKNVNALKQLIAYREKFVISNTGVSADLVRVIEDASVAATAKEIGSPDEPVGRTEFVIRLVTRYSELGVTPAEIKKTARSLGMKDLPKNFPYTTLWKLKEAKKIEERDGRYFPVVEW